MAYTHQNDFFIFKNTSLEKIEKELVEFLEYNKHTKLFKAPTYDVVKLEWSAVVMQRPRILERA